MAENLSPEDDDTRPRVDPMNVAVDLLSGVAVRDVAALLRMMPDDLLAEYEARAALVGKEKKDSTSQHRLTFIGQALARARYVVQLQLAGAS